MNSKDKKLYLYSIGAILAALGAYYLITRQKSNQTEEAPAKDLSRAENETVQTGTGSVITIGQATLPADLSNLMKSDIYKIVALLGNRKIYTKLEGAKVRSTPKVNNGILTNQYGTLPSKDFLIGTVSAVTTDMAKSTNSEGRVYKWFRVSLSPEAKKALGLLPNFNKPAYLREDTVIFK